MFTDFKRVTDVRLKSYLTVTDTHLSHVVTKIKEDKENCFHIYRNYVNAHMSMLFTYSQTDKLHLDRLAKHVSSQRKSNIIFCNKHSSTKLQTFPTLLFTG